MAQPAINLWASFLAGHGLTVERVDPSVLIKLCERLAAKGSPKVRPHQARLLSRELVCLTAMEAGIDLAGLKHRGRLLMTRGLLDAWNAAYAKRFGSNFGTSGVREASRRDVKARLAKPSPPETPKNLG